MLKALLLFLIFCSSDALAHGSQTPIPKAAAQLVTAVHDAAVSERPESLRKFMAPDFVSSFGGDGGPDEAIDLWGQDRSYLKQLERATVGECVLTSPGYLECPAQAGANHRAGFKLTKGGWRFFSFVAGD
ncbi:hypothetical protein [Xanthomonas arboricola]|uniref:hypothetical protein n=1 Tax=Xanthomonas arboricola TaxID=56448 RepID=UPI0006CAD722|nr:hypothetical protein [Xanthomonas arboricola]KPN07062.1 hypothetical protein AN651_10690 [Xanthomonas arboricola]